MPLSTEQQRLISMLDYLEHWDKLNRAPVFDVASHNGLVIWQNDLVDLPGFHLNTPDAFGEVWMEVERLRPIKPPTPSASLLPWLLIPDDPSKEPRNRESLPNLEDPEKPLLFAENPMLLSALADYMSGSWAKWAASEKPRRKSVAIYDRLFNLLQTIETEGAETAFELVWGIGVALWQTEKYRVRYPLISQLVEIDPINSDMALRIRPREVPVLLETDIYAALENAGLPAYERAARSILDNPEAHITPFDEGSFEQLLSGAAGVLDRQARYWPRDPDCEPGVLPTLSESLTVTNTWVLFARRKGTNFLIEDIRRLKAKVESEPVPDGAPTVLVETPEGQAPERFPRPWRGVSTSGFHSDFGFSDHDEDAASVGDLYFPKPFNAEQVQIIDRLENAAGVVVQGPPGTGKTHTIANVICHYLAEGKRVLVTTKGESALAVLRDQLPVPIQNLTVSLLTSEREGLKQLEQSVTKITSEITNLNKAEVQKEIARHRRRIDQLHQGITTIDRELGDWAKKNIDHAPPSLDGLKPAEMARRVVDASVHYEWFPDALDSRPEHEPACSLEDVVHLREARSRVGADIIYRAVRMPDSSQLPPSSEIGELHRSLIELQTIVSTLDEHDIPKLKAPSRNDLSDPARLRALLENAERVAKLLHEAAQIRRSLNYQWADWLRQQFEAEHHRRTENPVFAVVLQKVMEIEVLVINRRGFLGVAIEWEDDWDSDEDLFAAIQNAAAGSSPFGFLPFGKKEARARFQKVRLNGQAPKEQADWKWIESHASLRRQTRIAACGWNALADECPAPNMPPLPLAALRVSEELIEQMKQARRWVIELAPTLASDVQSVFADVQADGVVDDPERMEQLADAIELRVRRKRLEDAQHHANALLKLFQTSPLPCFSDGATFVKELLGNASLDSIAVENRWQEIANEFERIQAFRPVFETIESVCAQIESSGAVKWAKLLRETPAVPGQAEILPEDWAAAWKWCRQHGHLRSIDGRARVQELAKSRRTLQNDLSNAYTSLVEQLTWLKLKETLDKDRGLMSALQQYMAAVRGIGQGTGVRAIRFRQNARSAMSRANRAIRCWIMPHWRVSESLPADLAMFDLVVIDEASQSDLWALPAILRAKKLLIVGDNKQVSPSAIGVNEADIRLLHTRFLRTLPFGDVLSPDRSIYDLASVMFATDLIRLREHFRCVEPIIEFSNRLCYNGEIKSLRVPTAAERITPPLVDVFVRGGSREGRGKVNRIEAQAIVDEIKVLTDNPRFHKRTIGVVSLLGPDQPKHIFELLIAQIGEEKIVAHNIRCGDAMTFQGREADIIFVSMVTDGDSLRALSGEMYEQ